MDRETLYFSEKEFVILVVMLEVFVCPLPLSNIFSAIALLKHLCENRDLDYILA